MSSNFIRCALGLIVAGAVTAVGAATPQQSAEFVRITPAEIHWQDIPDGHGAKQAVLLGDPAKPGMYVVRVRFPPHIMDRPHMHSMARYVTVLEGTWMSGTGASFDLARAIPLGPGSVMLHPANGVHWDGSSGTQAVIVQIVGEGPATTTPMDPSKPMWLEVPH